MFESDGITPANGMFYIFATAEVVTNESAEFGDAERRGWVDDLNGSDVEESRNDVTPLISMYWPFSDPRNSVYDGEDDVRSEVRKVVEQLGAYQTYDGSTLYAADGQNHDLTNDETWLYALHAHVKHNGPNGWVETPVDVRNI